MRRIIHEDFIEHSATVGAEFENKKIMLKDNSAIIKVQIWDTCNIDLFIISWI